MQARARQRCPRRPSQPAALPRALIAAAVAAVLAPVAHADSPRPDTSTWTCKLCPFHTGASATVEGGVLYADGANASSGRYNGLAHDGPYALLNANGRWRTASGFHGSFDARRLGLASRGARLSVGREGRYELRLSYQGQPLREFDTTRTPFRSAGSEKLVLPSNWVAASTTSGLSALAGDLQPVRIQSDRRTVSVRGKYFASRAWTVFASLRHSERTGTDIAGASFLTEALQLPVSVDYATNTLEAGAMWSAGTASARLAYTGSWFKDHTPQLLFQNPYAPIVPGSTQGLLAQPPDNDLQQISLSGEIGLPLWSGTLTYVVSDGRLAQDGSFIAGSTLASAPVTLSGSLGGSIDLTHYALALALRPLSRLSLRGRATYDGRDDHTRALAIDYVVTDTLPGGTYLTPRYGEDHTRLTGSADYRLFHWLRAGAGGRYAHTHYSPGQVLTSLSELAAWGYGTVTPLPSLSLTAKAGSSRRDASAFHATALPVTENPLLRAYDYAPRDREFVTVRGTWMATPALTWSLEGSAATDAYRLSQFGLRESRERELSTSLAWAPAKTWSLYVDSSYQHLEALQNSLLTAGASWQARQGEYFWTLGAGGKYTILTRWHLTVDYVRSYSRSDTQLIPLGVVEWFPEDRTGLDTLKVTGAYRASARLTLRLRYERARYGTSDWALGNVYPDTIPTLLALGAMPYRYDLDLVGVSFVYRLGR